MSTLTFFIVKFTSFFQRQKLWVIISVGEAPPAIRTAAEITKDKENATGLSSQVHDGRRAARARGREEEGAAQAVAGSDRQPVSQQCFHSASPQQWKPHPSCHTTHYTFLLLSQQHTNRYETALDPLLRHAFVDVNFVFFLHYKDINGLILTFTINFGCNFRRFMSI